LRLAFGELGNQIMVPRMTSAFGKDPLVLAYDSLVGSDTKGRISQERGIASEWTLAEDNQSWTFKLRQGIKFQDGSDLTAQDAKFSIEQLILPDSGAGYAGTVRNGVESIEAVDDYTLVMHNPNPRPFFPWDVSGVRGTEGMIIPMDYFMSLGANQQERDNAFTQQPIGSGPYKVLEAKLGDRITLESWGEHWREGVPKYKQVQYLIVPEESTRIAMLQTGEADTADVSRERVSSLRDQGLNVFIKEKADVMGCYFHEQWEDVPVAKKEVRQALNLAINRQEVLDTLYAGQGELVAMYPIGSFSIGSGGDPNLQPYPYDPERAMELLASVGESDLEITIASYRRQGLPELERTIQAIAGYWQAIGVKVTTEAIEYGTFRDMRRTHKIPGWSSCLATPNRSAPSEILSIVNTLFRSDQQFSSMRRPEIDALVDQGLTSLNPEEVQQTIGEIHRWLYDEYATLPLLEVGNPFAVQPRITSWELGQDLYDFNTLYLATGKGEQE
jgi:peptide/nickel transport system substrate-binding protein